MLGIILVKLLVTERFIILSSLYFAGMRYEIVEWMFEYVVSGGVRKLMIWRNKNKEVEA